MWAPPTRLILTLDRSAGNPTAFGNGGHADIVGLRADWSRPRRILPFEPCCGRTRPVASEHRRESVDHVGAGSGLSRSMRRRMSANRLRGMATSAPRYWDGTRGGSELLTRCYQSIFELTATQGIESVSIPAIGMGIYRYPIEEATAIAFAATLAAQGRQNLSVEFVCFDEYTVKIYEEAYGRC